MTSQRTVSNPALLTWRYAARGFSLPFLWSASRMRMALLRPDLLAAKYTASASTPAQASASFLDDMRRVHCLSVSAADTLTLEHHAGRRPSARSMAAQGTLIRGGETERGCERFPPSDESPGNSHFTVRRYCHRLLARCRGAAITSSVQHGPMIVTPSPQEQGQGTLDVPARTFKCSRRRRAIKPHTRQQR